MIKLVDRLLVFAYLKAYLVCLVSLMSLYIVVDLFTNLEDFAQHTHGLASVLRYIGIYYGYRASQIFDRLCEAIVLLAATFTVAWMQRNNELLPLLSAGVSTRRVIRPVLLTACLMLGLTVANQEYVIPQVANRLMLDRDDPNGEKDIAVRGAFEPNGIHIGGLVATRKGLVVKNFDCVLPENIAGALVHLSAQQARYVPPGDGPQTGGWLLTGADPPELEQWTHPVLEMIDPGKYFLHTEEVDFDSITRPRAWYLFASTARLYTELGKSDSTRLASMAVLFHMRLTRPILGLILVFLGLSVILRDQNRNVFISAGLCLVLGALFYIACFICKHLGDNEYLSPALAAWLPVLGFGPLAFVLLDAIHT
jgi:lipopolysaccharide export system permease protein